MKLSALLEQQFHLPSIPKVVALLLTAISIGLAIGTGSGWDWWFDLANAFFTVAGCWFGGWLVARRGR